MQDIIPGSYARSVRKLSAQKFSDWKPKNKLHANECGLKINAGHGLNSTNLKEILSIPFLNEVNIGHSIISDAVFIGLKDAIIKIKSIIDSCD